MTSVKVRVPVAESALCSLGLTAHILAALSPCGDLVSHPGGGTVSLCAELWPVACQSQEWLSVFVHASCYLLYCSSDSGLSLILSSGKVSNKRSYEAAPLVGMRLIPSDFGDFARIVCVGGSCLLVLLRLCCNHFQIFLELPFITSFSDMYRC